MSVPTVTDDKNYYIYNQYGDNTMEPVGPIGIIAHNLASSFADSINYFLRNRRSIYLARHPELANNPVLCAPIIGFRLPRRVTHPVRAKPSLPRRFVVMICLLLSMSSTTTAIMSVILSASA